MSSLPFLSLLLLLLCIPCESSPACLSPFQCGNITIKYPFSLYTPQRQNQLGFNITSSYCGYPGLSISCKKNIAAMLHLESKNYTVFSIDYNNSTISLADTDILNSTNSCPSKNVSFAPYDWVSYTNADASFTFFFNCTVARLAPSFLPLACSEKSYVIQTSKIQPYDTYILSQAECQEILVAPFLYNDSSFDLLSEIDLALEKGFQLGWDKGPGLCGICEQGGGRCGYNLTGDFSFVETCLCEGGKCDDTGIKKPILIGVKAKKEIRKGLIIGTSIGGCGLLALLLISLLFWIKDRNDWLTGIGKINKTLNLEATLENCVPFAPKRYSFYEVRKMTRSFREKLGQGGYGTVFKGKLIDGTFVAVKVFKDRENNGKDFLNEVASIARTSHVNIVRLLGYSIKGSNRALIYEFMPNGSLGKYLRESQNSTMTHVECTRLYEITIGIARGLEYLHRGCNTRIVHFDIKPHNILLDQDYCPKISDFGLAKFCRPKESIISISDMRGTTGYIAPEVFSRNFGTISSKSDVYSYGMMIFEILGEKQNKPSEIVEGSSDSYFPDNIYKHLEENTISSIYGLSEVNEEIVGKMAIVGLWCIQVLPDARPTMTRVLDMLEGSVEDLNIPQKLHISLHPELVVDSSSSELLSQ